jgi:hypothetical protein
LQRKEERRQRERDKETKKEKARDKQKEKKLLLPPKQMKLLVPPEEEALSSTAPSQTHSAAPSKAPSQAPSQPQTPGLEPLQQALPIDAVPLNNEDQGLSEMLLDFSDEPMFDFNEGDVDVGGMEDLLNLE